MPPQPLLQALRQRPFVPFRLHVTDGATYEVRHPELVMLLPGYVAVGISQAGPPQAERLELIDLDHVTRLVPQPAGAPGNGQ